MEISQYDLFWVNLDPTSAARFEKSGPALLSPDEMNANIKTTVVAPLTTSSRNYPTRIVVSIGGKKGWIVLDQIRTIDKTRLHDKIGSVASSTVLKIKQVIKETYVD